MLLFYIFSSIFKYFVWFADFPLFLNTYFCFIFRGSVEFLRLSSHRTPPLPHLSLNFSCKFFSPFSIHCFSASLWRFTRYSFLILLSPLHLIFPSEASHPPFSSVFFFLLPAGTWLFVTCSIMELFPQYFMKITSESVFFQQFSSYFSDSGWVGRVTAGGKSLILIKNNC